MPLDILISLAAIAFAASLTPGPNNSMLASSGATYGTFATVPHILGVCLGFPVMIFLVGLGLGEIFRQLAGLQLSIRVLGAAMMLWIAWKIATGGRPGQAGATSRPLGFFAAAAFQWVNPKSWLAAIAVTSQFVTASEPVKSALIVALVFVAAGLVSTLAWTLFGQFLGRFLQSESRLRVFNYVMAALLLAFLLPVFLAV